MAYAISPCRGSEFSVAWNYVSHMSKSNRLTVLYGTSGEHMGDCDEMGNYIQRNPMENVRFVPIYPNRLANLLNWPNRHNLFVYTFYYAYQVWHKQAYAVAKDLLKHEKFDLLHYVGMIGYREPGYLWKLGLPYVWGPVGGANNAPRQLMKRMPLFGKIKLSFRSFANTIQLYTKRRLRQALAATDVLMTATSENQRKFKLVHGKESICLPENGITGNLSDNLNLDYSKFERVDNFRFIVVGRLDANKSVGVFLEALTQVKHKDCLHVDIVGGGPLRGSLEQYAVAQGLDGLITWHGQLPRNEAVALFRDAHLHVITSVSEGNPTTIWEAMSHGVPTLSFDHCVMHDTLRDGAGVLVPIVPTYEECVRGVAERIDALLEQPEQFLQLAEKTLERAHEYTWDKREIFLNDLYDKLLKECRQKC